MKAQMNPIVAAVVILVAVLGIGYVIWSKSAGQSFTKDEASRLDFKMPAVPAAAGGAGSK